MKLPTRILLTATTLVAFNTGARVRAQATVPAGPPVTGANAAVTLEAVQVTADLWESPLLRIPASVSVIDQAALEASAVRHFADLADQVPNFSWSGGTSRPRYFQIRGIGENSQFEGETPDSTVRFLVDDLDFTGLGSLASTFDVRQVEVLRGPQAGAFGANAAGGLVRLVSNAPTPFFSGNVEATIAGDGTREAGVAFGGPLLRGTPEKAMARLAIQRHVGDGFRRNLTLGRDTNERDELHARLRLTLNPSEHWRWDAAAVYSKLDNGYDEFALDNNGGFTFSDQPGRDEQESVAASLRGTFTGWSGVRLSTITSGSRVDSVYSYDDDWTAASYQGFSYVARERDVVSQELRLDSVATAGAWGAVDRWTLGAFFGETDEATRYTNEDPGNVRGLATGYNARHLALFGQAAHDFSERTRLIAGVRVEHLDLAGNGLKTRFRKSRGTFDTPVSFSPEFSDTLFGGKLTLEHNLTPRHLVFASVTRGYKGGGINIDARISPPADPLTYETEYLWNYEAGVRGHWLDQRLHGEFTAFYLQRRDAQVRDSAGFGGSYRFFTDNANEARVHGVEASASFALTPAWSLHGSVGLMDSWLDSFALANGSTGGGRELANAPEHGYTLATRYRAPSGLFGQVEWVARAEQFDSNNHNEPRRAFDVVNASIGYAWRDWTLSVWVRNAFDERYDKRVYFFGNEDPDYVPARYESRADPRLFGVTAAYRF